MASRVSSELATEEELPRRRIQVHHRALPPSRLAVHLSSGRNGHLWSFVRPGPLLQSEWPREEAFCEDSKGSGGEEALLCWGGSQWAWGEFLEIFQGETRM